MHRKQNNQEQVEQLVVLKQEHLNCQMIFIAYHPCIINYHHLNWSVEMYCFSHHRPWSNHEIWHILALKHHSIVK